MSENDTSGREPEAAPADARRRHADLSLEITEADHRYYILDPPTGDGIEYDTKVGELRYSRCAARVPSSHAFQRSSARNCGERSRCRHAR